ncbi:mitochondrial import receptor subunit TOM22 homolog [Paramacrobiotus metropolitanus]|uniref:mitochondrial import receptor subunit TOM22 homolog n=1 Tax=Paramacrobiotus metropolitanus TaxID=2943436 RepID=UPI00244581C0|nr:mitochondrial import receptor subunit TOM22 homolog [Paramacrobiotus metropolitanus]
MADHGGGGDQLILEYEEEFEEETLVERLQGLTEMFPEPVRETTSKVWDASKYTASTLYHYAREIMWVIASSAVILALPVALEVESLQIQEAQIQQQRQILLGPKAGGPPAKMAGGGGMPMMPPPPPPK